MYNLPFIENTETVFYKHFSAYCAELVWKLAYLLFFLFKIIYTLRNLIIG